MALSSIRLGHLFMRVGGCHSTASRCEHIRNKSSATRVESVAQTDVTASCNVQPFFYNRNPRNLEKMTLALKPRGYRLDAKNVNYWHKLVIKPMARHVVAQILHFTGVEIITVSTLDYGFKKSLYRLNDMCAFKALGEVIAQRCIESGIDWVACHEKPQEGTKLHALLEEVKNCGLTLHEPPVYKKPGFWGNPRPIPPWQIID